MLGQGGGGGRLSQCSKTNYDASPPSHLFSLTLFKSVACLYTLSTWLNITYIYSIMNRFFGTVDSHCNVPHAI